MKITRRQLRQIILEANIGESTKNMGKHDGKDKKLNKMKFVDFKDGLKNSTGVMNMLKYNTATGNFFMMERK